MTTPSPQQKARQSKRHYLWLLLLAIPFAGYLFWPESEQGPLSGTTFVARTAPLEVTVLEGGSVEALESQELKSQVQGETKILSIVEEGTYVTPDDVAEGRVLVELDSSRLLDEQIQQELQYQNALASLTEAREQFEIQLSQNASDVSEAELAVKFARMDMQKYLGSQVADELVAKVDALANEAIQRAAASEKELPAVVGPAEAPEESADSEIVLPVSEQEEADVLFVPLPEVDYRQYASPDRLGDGEARQKLRTLENDLVLAEEEVGLAQTQVEGTKRLFDKDFVTKNDLENDELKLKRQEISVESAETTRELFVGYEFPKEAERLVADYVDAIRKLERTKKQGVSKIAQDEAKLKSAEAQFTLQQRRKRELQEQIEACTIRAERPGLVVYGGDDRGYRDDDQITEGTSIRERQVIITIPDTTKMAVNVKVHESSVNKVRVGQEVRIRVDAYPDERLTGRVSKIGVLPDSQNRWLNPDLKVYATLVTIDGTHDWLKPGMTAEAEIVIERLDNALQVPLQAVQSVGNQRVVFVPGLGGAEMRPVDTGLFNDIFIEIRDGLVEGESVTLRTPAGFDKGATEEAGEGEASAQTELEAAA